MSAKHPVLPHMLRGLAFRCPECGQGKLYRKYLKVSDRCAVCAHPLGEYRADDGPAYFTILLIGHLVVAPLLLFPIIWRASAWIIVPCTLIPLAGLSMLLLPRVKGALIGLLYALKITGEQEPGSELSASEG